MSGGVTAALHLSENLADTASLAATYRRRVEHLNKRGHRFVGDDIAHRLEHAGPAETRIALIHRSEWNGFVFLDSDLGSIFGCIAADASLGNPDFAWDAAW